VTSRDLTPFVSVAVCLERQSLFSAVVGRHTAGVASRSVRCPGAAVRARKGGSKTSRCRNRRAFIYNMYKKGCWYLVALEPFGDGVRDLEECSGRESEESAARTYCLSGRTWTLLALPVRGKRKKGERKAGWPGFPHSGKERARKKGESGKAGVPSQWEGTGQEEMEKSGKPGFPRNGRERTRKKWRKRESRGSLAMGGNGPGRNGESGKAGVRSQLEGTGQEERRKRESRGSFAMGGNGPGRKEKAGCRLGRKRSRSRFWS
jgi:hypothetical protein